MKFFQDFLGINWSGSHLTFCTGGYKVESYNPLVVALAVVAIVSVALWWLRLRQVAKRT